MRRAAAGLWGAMTCLLLLASAPVAHAQTAAPAAGADATAFAGAPPTAPTDLEPFVDGLVQGALRTERIAGAGVAIVRGGEVLLLKGYGQADAAGRPVDPQRTLFRIASISKTFTWIALLQLVEEGRVDLDQPANAYLPPALQIPDDGFAAPVLVRHLLTHSAGFEDIFAGHLFVADPARAVPLVDALVRHRPRRVRPPGVAAIYSNYGVALAGAIVQQVTGRPFEGHVEQRVFAPLGLQDTTFREPYAPSLTESRGLPSPMSPALAADLAQGLAWRGGAYGETQFEHMVQFAPAGAASTTAADMARYMIALGAGGGGVLRPGTVALLARPQPQFANAPGLNGVAWGMLQGRSDGGWRWWGHDGDTLSFHAALTLFPDLDLGVFVATNSPAGGALRDLLPGRIADRIAGAQPTAAPAPRIDLAPFVGDYLADRRSYSTVERAFCLVRCAFRAVADDGALLLQGGGDVVRLAPVDAVDRAPGLRIHRFRNVETGAVSAFVARGGKVTHYLGASGVSRATRISAFATPQAFAVVTGAGLLAAVAALLSGLSRVFSAVQGRPAARAVGLLLPVAGIAWLVTLAAYGAYFLRAMADAWVVFADWPGSMRIGAMASLPAVAATALALIATAFAWLKADWSVWRRTRILATLGAMVALAVMLHAWNMIGLRF